MINKNDSWATVYAKRDLEKNRATPEQYKELKAMYTRAIDGKVKVLNASQIAKKAINAKANSTNMDVWNKMGKILAKTRHEPFMFRTENAWDKPSLQEDPKHGVKENDSYYVGLARAGNFAKQFRKKRASFHGKFREHPQELQDAQDTFANRLKGIDYEEKYREMSAWYKKANHKVDKDGTGKKGLKNLISKKYGVRNVDNILQRDNKFMKSMHKQATKRHFSTLVKSSSVAAGITGNALIHKSKRPTLKTSVKYLFSKMKSPNYKAIGKHIKHGAFQLFNKVTGVAKKSGKIVADRLTKLGQHLNKNPQFHLASKYVTRAFDTGVQGANHILDKIGMPSVGTNARRPRHMKKHDFSRIAYTFSPHKHEIRKSMRSHLHRTQHLSIGPTI